MTHPVAPQPGRLYLVPNALDTGVTGTPPDLREVLPEGVIRIAAQLGHWVVENAKTTRAFLKRVDAVTPLAQPLQQTAIVELPRARKGSSGSTEPEVAPLLAPAMAGSAMGLMSEAGLPAVADPGARLVAAAHAAGIEVVALPGPSSLLLALAASGLHGQSFSFCGYLPVEPAERAQRIRALEAESRQRHQTQIVIETPYRNPALLAALLEHLQPATQLAVSCGLTLAQGFNRSGGVAQWRARPTALPTDVPAVFSFLAT